MREAAGKDDTENMADETKQFSLKLEQLCALGRRSSMRLSVGQIQSALEDTHLTKEQMQMVYTYLDQMAIEVYDPETGDSLSPDIGRRPSLELYLEEIDRLPHLPEDAEYLLFERAAAGDAEAANTLIERYLTTACDLAAEFEETHPKVEVEDLVQEANTGLVMAMTEIKKQKSLALYRVWLLNYITSFLEDSVQRLEEMMNSDVRIVNRMNKLADTVRELEEEMGHKPAVEELSAFLELPSEEIRNLLRVADMDISQEE